MIKYILTAVMAFAIGGGVLTAADAVKQEASKYFLQDAWAENCIPFPENREFSHLDADTRKAELERFLPLVQKSTSVKAKISYAHVATAFWFSQNLCDTWDELDAKFDEIFATTNPPATLTDYQKDLLLQYKLCSFGSYAGNTEAIRSKNDQLNKEAFAKYGDKTGEVSSSQMGWIVYSITQDLDKVEPYWIKSHNQIALLKCRLTQADVAKAAGVYWEQLGKGTLPVDLAEVNFPKMLAYELEKENADTVALKARIKRAILVYQTRARLWKATAEEKVNPYLEFVGMMNDTIKDL